MKNKTSTETIYNYIALYKNDKKYKSAWEERGFVLTNEPQKYIWKEGILEALILEKEIQPFTDFSILQNKKIEDVSDCIVFYERGKSECFCLKYRDNKYMKWIVIDCKDKNLFMDKIPFVSNTKEEEENEDTWYKVFVYNRKKTRNTFYNFLKNMTIVQVSYENNILNIKLKDDKNKEHEIYTVKDGVQGIYTIFDKSKILKN